MFPQPCSLPVGFRQSLLCGNHLEVEVVIFVFIGVVFENFGDFVVIVEEEHGRFDLAQIIRRVDVFGSTDNDFVSRLAAAGGCSVQDAAIGARFSKDDVGGSSFTVGLVPDINVLQRIDPGLFAMQGIKGDRALVIEIAVGNFYTV
jgi:hypothetical protein